MKKIFVAGHKGLVGSAIIKKLSKRNKILTVEKKKLDLLNYEKTLNYFKKHKFDQVYLCAAKVGGIYANSKYPADFIYQNLQIQNNCIISAYKTKVNKLLFLGSSCVYPKKPKIPIKERFLLSGELEKTNEAYAISKIAGIKMCESFNIQYNTDFRAVMPTNLYGPNDNYDDLNSHVLAALIKKILKAKQKNKNRIVVWGNGNAKREFLHTYDLADACIKIMRLSKKNFLNIVEKNNQFINIGYGKEISIKELTKLICKIINFHGTIVYDKTKPNGTYRKLIDSSRIRKINWKPKISLTEGISLVIKELNQLKIKY
jgi:GDP-L-fucose synthase